MPHTHSHIVIYTREVKCAGKHADIQLDVLLLGFHIKSIMAFKGLAKNTVNWQSY